MSSSGTAAEGEAAPAQPASEKEPDMPGPREESEEEDEDDEEEEEEEEEKEKSLIVEGKREKKKSREVDDASLFFTKRAIYNRTRKRAETL